MLLEAYQELTATNLVLLAIVAIAFIFIFFVFLKRLIGFAFWALLLFIVLIVGFSIYDDRLATAAKQLVSPGEGNTAPLDQRFTTLTTLLKEDAEEVLAKWQFLWKPSPIKKEPTPTPAPETTPAPAPAPEAAPKG